MFKWEEELVKLVTEHDWMPEEIWAEVDRFNRDELPRIRKQIEAEKKYIKKCKRCKLKDSVI